MTISKIAIDATIESENTIAIIASAASNNVITVSLMECALDLYDAGNDI